MAIGFKYFARIFSRANCGLADGWACQSLRCPWPSLPKPPAPPPPPSLPPCLVPQLLAPWRLAPERLAPPPRPPVWLQVMRPVTAWKSLLSGYSEHNFEPGGGSAFSHWNPPLNFAGILIMHPIPLVSQKAKCIHTPLGGPCGLIVALFGVMFHHRVPFFLSSVFSLWSLWASSTSSTARRLHP